jgi:hypothetical protein
MTSRVAIAFCLLLSLSGSSLASGAPEPGADAAEDAAAQDETSNPAAPSSEEDQDTDDTTGQAEPDDQEQAPIDVHRHRPGACPEGPPCKGDE